MVIRLDRLADAVQVSDIRQVHIDILAGAFLQQAHLLAHTRFRRIYLSRLRLHSGHQQTRLQLLIDTQSLGPDKLFQAALALRHQLGFIHIEVVLEAISSRVEEGESVREISVTGELTKLHGLTGGAQRLRHITVILRNFGKPALTQD